MPKFTNWKLIRAERSWLWKNKKTEETLHLFYDNTDKNPWNLELKHGDTKFDAKLFERKTQAIDEARNYMHSHPR